MVLARGWDLFNLHLGGLEDDVELFGEIIFHMVVVILDVF
jgi:hypothetical protein